MIKTTPKTINTPNIISEILIFRLYIIGSIKDAKKAPAENIDNAIDTLDCLIDSKKVIQCKATISPAIENLIMSFLVTRKLVFAIKTYTSIKNKAMAILNQTSGAESIVISFPNIPVKPAISTNTCK